MLIILDLVITNKPRFVKNANRLNIALTQARDGLIIIGNIAAIEKAYDSRKKKRSSNSQQPLLIQLSDNYKKNAKSTRYSQARWTNLSPPAFTSVTTPEKTTTTPSRTTTGHSKVN